MDERPESGAERASRLRGLGEDLPRMAERFEDDGALAVLLVDAQSLSEIEPLYGGAALQEAMGNLANLVEELIGGFLEVSDLVVAGETGREEIAVLLFRGADDVDFYKREVERARRVLGEGLERRGHRAGYPYLRKLPPLWVGVGTALRNPTIRAELQIRRALEDAREHIDLVSRLERRRRRKQLFDLVLEGQIYSVYEPIVDVTTRTVFGYEALARGPEGTELHSPARLFAMASEQDLVFQLDCLCRQSGLDGARDLPGGAKLFLNVRPTTIHDPSFRAEVLETTLARCQLSPSDVVLEVSEQESIGNFEIFARCATTTGSSASRSRSTTRAPATRVSNRSWSSRPTSSRSIGPSSRGSTRIPGVSTCCARLQSLADRIGARIIGEGLDTLEELETLGRLGIEFGQGWLFGKPHPLRSD